MVDFDAVRVGRCRTCLDCYEMLDDSGRCSSCVQVGVTDPDQVDDGEGTELMPA